jgi:hypothetical protein
MAASEVVLAASEVVLDMVSQHLDQDFCVSRVNCCKNCLRLKDYVEILVMELKSSRQIVKILHEDHTNSHNLKKQVNSQSLKTKVSTNVESN